MSRSFRRVVLSATIEVLRLKAPVRITGRGFETVPVLVGTLEGAAQGGGARHSASNYLNDAPDGMALAVVAVAAEMRWTAPCGSWRRARPAGRPALAPPKPLLTDGARAYADAKALKLKLTGEPELDVAHVRAGVRTSRWASTPTRAIRRRPWSTTRSPCWSSPSRAGARPISTGSNCPSGGGRRELPEHGRTRGLPGRFDLVNIKLDKCGDLTEGLMMAVRARERGLNVMVGIWWPPASPWRRPSCWASSATWSTSMDLPSCRWTDHPARFIATA
ncbi:MAG: hypothetical protein WA840_08460 [Caulobacteraceae bacterium]